MAEKRRLQTEIDRTLKKVVEGVEIFEDIWGKFRVPSSATQKEKCEVELKKEIKKLQRYRDQIKTWYSSGDVKDKDKLMKYRRIIETQMERFKIVERQTKTKAYSKEGLGAAANQDPMERKKQDIENFLHEMIQQLRTKNETLEGEIERIQDSCKKRKVEREKQNRLNDIKDKRQWNTFHIEKLEHLLRIVDNELIDLDRVTAIKDDLEYFLDQNAEDYDYQTMDYLYDDFSLDEISIGTQVVKLEPDDEGLPISYAEAASEFLKTESSTNHVARKNSIKSASYSKVSSKACPVLPPRLPSSGESVSSLSSDVSSAPTTPVWSGPLQSSTSSSVWGNSAFSGWISSSNIPEAPTPVVNAWTNKGTSLGSTESLSNGVVSSVSSSLAVLSLSSKNSVESDLSNTLLQNGPVSSLSDVNDALTNEYSHKVEPLTFVSSSPDTECSVSSFGMETDNQLCNLLSRKIEDDESHSCSSSILSQPPSLVNSFVSSSTTTEPTTPSDAIISSNVDNAPLSVSYDDRSRPSSPALEISNYFTTPTAEEGCGVLITPVMALAPLGKEEPSEEYLAQFRMLATAHHHMPHPSDSERLRHHLPRNPCDLPAYYPRVPPSNCDSLEFFSRLSAEALFFAFYYMEGTHAQYLAAKALKQKSWRFHSRYMMWFQRHEEPTEIRDDYERGTYIYFDYEKWTQRRRNDFQFEYKFLEDRELN